MDGVYAKAGLWTGLDSGLDSGLYSGLQGAHAHIKKGRISRGVSSFILYLIYSQCYFWVHDPLNILPYSTLCYSTVRGRALMAVKFKFAMKNS